MASVARGATGFIAAGTAGGNTAIWISPEGLTWTRIPDDPMFQGPKDAPSYATGVAVRDGAIVVVGMAGYGDPPRARAWWSADGTTWAKAPVERGKGGQFFSVAATIDGFLATGPSGAESCLGGIWASTDGQAWRCDASAKRFADFSPYAAAASDTIEVVVGLTDAGYDEESPDPVPGDIWSRTWS